MDSAGVLVMKPAQKPDERGWAWPDPPTTPREVIAGHLRSWGPKLAYDLADTLLIELACRGFSVTRTDDESAQENHERDRPQ
jgi:hypothetical protein